MSQTSAVMPLAFAQDSEEVQVVHVKGSSELRQHLAELGFVEGSKVQIVSHVQGDVIVLVKGSRLGLNRQMATHIMVTLN